MEYKQANSAQRNGVIAEEAMSRRAFLRGSSAAASSLLVGHAMPAFAAPWTAETGQRPAPADRRFRSEAVEAYITRTATRIGDPVLRRLFINCYPNTLDTTVEPGDFEGRPDTAVITGDIPAVWLRDSSAQVWPYLPLAAKDEALRRLLEGVIRRHARCLLIDTYANAFMADLTALPLEWGQHDKTKMKRGVGERKYELDSLCYPIRLAHGYWKATGNTAPFDERWRAAMQAVLHTMRVQQRKDGEGPYRFQREAANPTDSLINGIGAPANPVGMIACCFRPSDDACTYPFLVPANLFAVTSLRHLAEMAREILRDNTMAAEATSLADEVAAAVRKYGVATAPAGTIWAYEVDGFGSQALMDDANVPSLLSLPYIRSSPDAALYARTRKFVWSNKNPWYFCGSAGEGIGGPHIGRDSIWPMSQIIYALTSTSDSEISHALTMLKASAAATGFMHESYTRNDSAKFTRSWFAWANMLFGELVGTLAERSPNLLV